MEKTKKTKIIIGLSYLIILSLFLIFFFSQFNFKDLTSYKFIQLNRENILNIKENNLFLLTLIFFIFTIVWVFLLGFGSPIFLMGGFIYGKWAGTIIVVLGLSIGSTLLYAFGNYFLKDYIKKFFSNRYKNLEKNFKKKEFLYFLLFRFVGGIPFAIANLLPILVNMNLKNYFFATLIGLMPSIFIGVSLGNGLEKVISKNNEVPSILDLLFSSEIYLPIIGFSIIILLTFILRKIFFKNF